MRHLPFLSLFLLVPLIAACRSDRSESARAALETQLQEDWRYWMEQYPEAATLLGYPGQNARWTDYSPEAIDARAEYLRRSLERLGGVERGELDAAGQLDYDLYRDLLSTAVDGLQFHNDAMPVRGVMPTNLMMPITQISGIQQEIPRIIASMPRATRQDYENIITRLQGVGPLVRQTIALLEQGIAAGVTPPAIAVRDVPAQAGAQVVVDPTGTVWMEPFGDFPTIIPEAERAALRARAEDAYRDIVRPAFEQLRDFLATRYVPACRDTTAITALPDGAAFYAYLVKWHTTTALSPREIHDVGLAEVKRLRAEMDEVIAASGFIGSYPEFVRFLRTDPRFYFTDPEALLTAYRDIAKRADPELAPLFARLPQSPYGVRAIPAAVAPSQTTAYYDPGAFNVGRPGYMFANTYKLEARPKWEMEALTLHEAVPGHHLQISLAQELQGLPEFRKNSSYTSYVEGWALYSESLGYEMGFYTDPYARFGQLTYEMWRAVRLVVDTGLHTMGWTRQQAIDFFAANAAKTEQDIVVEIDRYLVIPGQALGYKIGQMKISELRDASARKMGERFDVRQFHDVVLGEGAVPLDVLESRINAWASR